MSGLDQVISEVRAIVNGAIDVELAPDYVPDQMNVGSLLLVYADSGDWTLGAAGDPGDVSCYWGVHTIKIRLHVLRGDVSASHAKMMTLVDPIAPALFTAFAKDQLSIISLGDYRSPGATRPLTYAFGPGAVGGAATLVWTFFLTVSIEEEFAS